MWLDNFNESPHYGMVLVVAEEVLIPQNIFCRELAGFEEKEVAREPKPCYAGVGMLGL
jgi:hypothetical protein